MERRLTAEAENDRAAFEAEYRDHGCTCFICAPCGYCTHPGHPISLEDELCWEPVEPEVPDFLKGKPKRLRDW